MNKQEAIKGIKSEKLIGVLTYEEEAYNNGLKDALEYVEKINMPERPVLTKEEAEWIEGLKEEQKRRPFWTKYSMLYFVTRAGFGYGFSYDHYRDDREVELEHYSHEIHAEKERLTNAILYGYEIEKKKLYTVEIPDPNGSGKHVLIRGPKGNVFIGHKCHNDWRNISYYQLTESEIKEDFGWAFRWAKEVKND